MRTPYPRPSLNVPLHRGQLGVLTGCCPLSTCISYNCLSPSGHSGTHEVTGVTVRAVGLGSQEWGAQGSALEGAPPWCPGPTARTPRSTPTPTLADLGVSSPAPCVLTFSPELISSRYGGESPQPQWLKKTQVCDLPVLEARSQNQPHKVSEGLRGSFHALFYPLPHCDPGHLL